MSGEEESDSPQEIYQYDDSAPTFLEDLKGDSPKIWGFDYYNVIYSAAAVLSLIMLGLYTVIDDPEV